ncbi:unnamed protein product [Soboliphyme baturini]|uniref:Acid-soluble spore protein K n=1 Tax=Soboliphyme baturini TaxID=241478 RepID=A0A183IW53_9BILA|nr:unnamed protein product [Soboliphyme baturini]
MLKAKKVERADFGEIGRMNDQSNRSTFEGEGPERTPLRRHSDISETLR